jgi:hypothetical protein
MAKNWTDLDELFPFVSDTDIKLPVVPANEPQRTKSIFDPLGGDTRFKITNQTVNNQWFCLLQKSTGQEKWVNYNELDKSVAEAFYDADPTFLPPEVTI